MNKLPTPAEFIAHIKKVGRIKPDEQHIKITFGDDDDNLFIELIDALEKSDLLKVKALIEEYIKIEGLTARGKVFADILEKYDDLLADFLVDWLVRLAGYTRATMVNLYAKQTALLMPQELNLELMPDVEKHDA